MVIGSVTNLLPIGKPWAWDLWPGSIGNVSEGGTFFKFSADTIPYPVNSNNFFSLKGGNRARKRRKTTRKRIRRRTNRKRFKISKTK